MITVAGPLNYEGTDAWPLLVRVNDQNGNVFDKPFVINVTNVNDAPSGITLSGGTVPEHSPGGTIIATATGIDQDAGTAFTWSLTNNAGGRFLIYQTGQIAVIDSGLINYEAASSYQVTVRATDQGGLYLDKVVTLSLSNVNEAPTGITLSGGSAPENSPGGTIIATASGIDPDAGTAFTWSLTDNAGGRFLIYQTGQIAIIDSGLINYETASSYQVTVRAADQGGLYVDKSFTLNLTNVNEAPTNATLVGGAVLENAPAGAYVATIAGIDPDANTVFNYSLVNPDGRFAIDASTGVVTVLYGALLDYESATSHQITVRTADQGGLSFDKSWTVNVYDANDAPTDARLFGGTVREHSANGTRVGTVIGTDPDAGSVLSYTLLDDAGGRFDVNASTGVITVQDGTLLDYATAQSHTLMVRTSDQSGLFYDRPLTVAIAAGPVNNANGTSTVTIHDGADAFGWSSFTSTYNGPDGHGSLLSQLGINDGGSKWQNVYDVAHTQSWNFTVSTFDSTDHLLTRTATNDDGTHSLLVNDVAGTANWSTFTMNFDANWNYVSLSNVVMDPGQTLDMGLIWSALDTLTWYATPYTVGPAPKPTVSDFNGDGRTDLLLINDVTRGWYICEMNGAQIGVNAQVGTITAGWRIDGLGDFNADGKSDVVLLNDATHQVYAVEMDGIEMGPHALIATVRADLGWYYKGLGDFNGDGKSDFFIFNDASRGVYVCTMDGLQRGSEAFTGTINAGSTFQTLGDFNGDGKADLAFLNDATKAVTVWQMNGTQVQAAAQVGTVLAGYHHVGQGDFNGDGKTDLVFQNDITRAEQLWQMNGTEILENSQMALVTQDWHLVI